MTAREQVEYSALRATIRERGTVRIGLFAAGIAAWAAIATATAALAASPVATLLPLLVLASVYEAVFTLHVGVERIGRYLQVFFETDGTGWEHAAMAFGRPPHAAGLDPLFTIPFVLAALFNAMPAAIVGPTRAEAVFIGGAHLLFVIRLVAARDAARRQRAVDLARFEELRASAERAGG